MHKDLAQNGGLNDLIVELQKKGPFFFDELLQVKEKECVD